uniref:Protein FAR1-RELATED SEQUENCE n=1 Tax=Musa acuminata subsp. malaccensis TaxID=214687 RepID=A0A804IAZ5_MUSAM|nr:PREDICTED: protein FAR1-RELATED SEQUENCE 2 isoform X2 [Musa acuminata subsp. malaccensis]
MEQDESPLESSDEELICDKDSGNQERMEKRVAGLEIVKAPEPGMTFPSLDALVEYYKKYGKQEGFRVSRKSRTISSSGKIEHVTIACSREGKPYIYKRNILQPKPTTKTGCKARVNATLFENMSCRINSVRLEHSHSLVPRKSRFCMCNRDLSIGAQKRLELNNMTGTGVNRNDTTCSVQAGGCETAPTLEKDCKNSVEKASVNHHGQSILFGCGLLSNEDTMTFTWLFRAFLSCMSGRAPNAIITDQDKAMQKAIETVFPGIRHRWCLWHIMKKLPEKFKGYRVYEEMRKLMQNAVYDSFTKEEFEESWTKFIEKFNLYDNAWLKGLYEERHRWVPAFVKDSFWAGMSTTQRSQRMNPFFDGLVYSKTTMKQFVEQYDVALESKVEREDQADFQSFNSWVPCVTHFDIEKQFQQVYTIDKFKEFQQEMVAKLYCEVTLAGGSDGISEYDVSEDVLIGDDDDQHHKLVHFKVHFTEGDCEVQCSCHLFEFKGIICRHMISVLVKRQISSVPSRYILPRWRKDLKRRHMKVRVGYCGWSNNPKAQRYDYIHNKFDEAADMAVESDEYSEMLWSCIDDFQKRINKSDVDGKGTQHPSARLTIENRLLSPLALRRQGRPSTKRKVSKVEQTIKKHLQPKKKGQSSGEHDQQVSQHHQTVDTYARDIVGATAQGSTEIGTQETILQANATYGQYPGQVLNMQHVGSNPLLPPLVQVAPEIRGSTWGQHGVSDYPFQGYNDNK